MEKELTETNMNSRPIEDIDELLWKFINVALRCVVSDLILSAALSPSPSLTLPENEHIKHKVNVCVSLREVSHFQCIYSYQTHTHKQIFHA